MKPAASVVICTHNPRRDYLSRVLLALKAQTLPLDQWELLLIDNASDEVLAGCWDLTWHPQGRHVREEELGVTAARLRGIQESVADTLIVVDDDNVLCPDYLESALCISRERPCIGAFGASSTAEFEEAPSESVAKYLVNLAVDQLTQDYWTNLAVPSKAVPFGAGLCVRRSVANAYYYAAKKDPRRKQLGRIGIHLGTHEDLDMALCAIDLGMGIGRFRRLKFTHLISKQRVSEDYIARFVAVQAGTEPLLNALRNVTTPAPEPLWYYLAKLCWHLTHSSRLDRKIIRATRKVRARTETLLQSWRFS